MRSFFAFSISNRRMMVSPQTANIPLASHPYTTNGQWKGTEKISSEIHKLWPHSLAATVIHSNTAALISRKNDHGKPLSGRRAQEYGIVRRCRRRPQRRKREEEIEHRNVRRSERGIAHHGLMPRAIPVRPEAGFDINRQARDPMMLHRIAIRRTSSARSQGFPSISRPVRINQPNHMPVKTPSVSIPPRTATDNSE